MSGTLSVEELRERAEALMDSISSLSDGMKRLRQEVSAKEKRVRALQGQLEAAGRVGDGLSTTLVETVGVMGASLPFVAGGLGTLVGVVALLFGISSQVSTCDAPPEPMRLEGLGTVMVGTREHAPLGARCDFFASQVGRGECRFELRCEGAELSYAETHRCITDSVTRDTGEGGSSTSYYLRGMGDVESVFSFSEVEQLLELKDGDFRFTVVFHELSGRSVLDSEGEWPEASAE